LHALIPTRYKPKEAHLRQKVLQINSERDANRFTFSKNMVISFVLQHRQIVEQRHHVLGRIPDGK